MIHFEPLPTGTTQEQIDSKGIAFQQTVHALQAFSEGGRLPVLCFGFDAFG
jgi:hypothetical protein